MEVFFFVVVMGLYKTKYIDFIDIFKLRLANESNIKHKKKEEENVFKFNKYISKNVNDDLYKKKKFV